MPKPKQTQTWDRRAGESPPAYQAFRLYLDLGSDRSLAAVAGRIGRNLATISGFSVKWEWQARSLAWDNHNDRVQQEARDKVRAAEAAKWERRRLKETEAVYRDGRKLRDRVRELLKWPVFEEEMSEDGRFVIKKPARWSEDSLGRLAKMAAELIGSAIESALTDAELDAFDPSKATPEEAQSLLDRIAARSRDRDTSGGTR